MRPVSPARSALASSLPAPSRRGELPVLDGFDGLIHAGGHEQQLCARETKDDLAGPLMLCWLALHRCKTSVG